MSNHLNNCLHLLLSSIVGRIINIEISDSKEVGVSSDHKVITFDVNVAIRSLNRNPLEIFKYKKADFEGLRTALRYNPPAIYFENDNHINEDWTIWKTSLSDKLGTFVPKRVSRKYVMPPWIDGEVHVSHYIR